MNHLYLTALSDLQMELVREKDRVQMNEPIPLGDPLTKAMLEALYERERYLDTLKEKI